MATANVRIHPTADVSAEAEIGQGTTIWHGAQVREGVRIGESCIIGKGVYIDFGVSIGSRVKIQNRASVYHGVRVEDGVFIGPHVCLTNDKFPRAITPEGELKTADDWEVSSTLVQQGASLGAGSIILPGIAIGRFAMVGAGSVVTNDVPAHGLVLGNPARLVGYVCRCGFRLVELSESQTLRVEDHILRVSRQFTCPHCQRQYSFDT